MTLLYLSLRNARKNANRSLVAILGMAVAAALMTGATAMTTGYAIGAYEDHRSFMTADIAVYAGEYRFGPEQAGLGQAKSDVRWVFRPGLELEGTDLAYFHPAMAAWGYVAPTGGTGPITDDVLEAISSVTGVKSVARVASIPCVLKPGDPDGPAHVLTWIRGRDEALDTSLWNFARFITDGRYLGPSSQDEALLSQQTVSLPPPKIGRTIELLLPKARIAAPGTSATAAPTGTAAGWDFSELLTHKLKVVGQFAVPTELQTVHILGDFDSPSRTVLVQRYWKTDEIIVSLDTLRALYSEMGGKGLPPVYQAGVTVESMFDAKSVASALSRRFPGLTFVPVPEQVERARWEAGQPSVPQDLSRVFYLLAYAGAGFLVTANMYVLLSQRRKEMGVLKAIGASALEVFAMVLLEALSISLLGALSGFVVVRGFFTMIYLYTDVGLFRAGMLTLESVGRVIAFTTGISLVSSLGPAYQAARLTTAEVLKDG
jgi:ABC-type antimicrobial peptide transport system permease subunit